MDKFIGKLALIFRWLFPVTPIVCAISIFTPRIIKRHYPEYYIPEVELTMYWLVALLIPLGFAYTTSFVPNKKGITNKPFIYVILFGIALSWQLYAAHGMAMASAASCNRGGFDMRFGGRLEAVLDPDVEFSERIQDARVIFYETGGRITYLAEDEKITKFEPTEQEQRYLNSILEKEFAESDYCREFSTSTFDFMLYSLKQIWIFVVVFLVTRFLSIRLQSK